MVQEIREDSASILYKHGRREEADEGAQKAV